MQGSLLHYAKGVAEKATEGAAVLDCTIAVPPFFGPAQRQAVIDAAEIAGAATHHTLCECMPLLCQNVMLPLAVCCTAAPALLPL